jgi:hypothetical protein
MRKILASATDRDVVPFLGKEMGLCSMKIKKCE